MDSLEPGCFGAETCHPVNMPDGRLDAREFVDTVNYLPRGRSIVAACHYVGLAGEEGVHYVERCHPGCAIQEECVGLLITDSVLQGNMPRLCAQTLSSL